MGSLTHTDILNMTREDLGLVILEHLVTASDRPQRDGVVRQLGHDRDGMIAVRAAWQWLITEGLIVPDPQQSSANFVAVTSVGRQVVQGNDFLTRWRARRLLGRDVHRDLARAKRQFEQGDWESATAFREIEIRMRSAIDAPDDLVGAKLMREAFGAQGKLADEAVSKGEQVSVMELFSGAYGAYRNPVSHRDVHLDDPHEAAEALLLADLLMRIVDRAIQRRPPSR